MLNKNCLKLLKYMDKHIEIDYETAIKLVSERNAGESIAHLIDIRYITGNIVDVDVDNDELNILYDYPYHLTVEGQGYLENVRSQNKQVLVDNFNKWYGTIIGTAALIIAVLAYIKQ